jgi:hypothetical protein
MIVSFVQDAGLSIAAVLRELLDHPCLTMAGKLRI